jgi:hypothetical protein
MASRLGSIGTFSTVKSENEGFLHEVGYHRGCFGHAELESSELGKEEKEALDVPQSSSVTIHNGELCFNNGKRDRFT